jgi:hypothetical protein
MAVLLGAISCNNKTKASLSSSERRTLGKDVAANFSLMRRLPSGLISKYIISSAGT